MKANLSRATLALTFPVILLVLSGCGKVLDWRNAEVSNGKVYESGANTPFSGKVTNGPVEKVLTTRRSWGFAMRPIVQTPSWADRVKTGQSLCDLKVDDGVVDGEVICTRIDNKAVHYEVSFKGGELHGKFTMFDGSPQKNVVVSASFKNGEIDGTHKFFSPKNQQLLRQMEWSNGKGEGETASFDEETGKKTSSITYREGKAEGPMQVWSADGKTVLHRATFSDGKLVGLEEQFYPDGKKKGEINHVEGMRHGIVKWWDENGRLVSHTRYERGAEVQRLPLPDDPTAREQTAVNVQPCVDKWLAFHHKVAGANAPVRADVLEEWENECRAGKEPK